MYNLTLVNQVLTKVTQSGIQYYESSNNYTLNCINNYTLFILPSIDSNISVSYSKYINSILKEMKFYMTGFSEASNSTICLSPPFNVAYKLLTTSYNSVLNNLPLLAAYYQYCGFGVNYKILFVDDSKFPTITIYQGTVVVDLYRLMGI